MCVCVCVCARARASDTLTSDQEPFGTPISLRKNRPRLYVIGMAIVKVPHRVTMLCLPFIPLHTLPVIFVCYALCESDIAVGLCLSLSLSVNTW